MWSRRSLTAAAGAAPFANLIGAALSFAGAPAGGEGPIVVPMRLSDDRFWTEVLVNGKGPYKFILDTGAGSYFVQSRLIEEAGLTYAPSANVRGITGNLHADRRYVAKELVIGGVLLDRNVDMFIEPDYGEGFAGIIPHNLVALRPSEVDFAEGRVVLYDHGATPPQGFQDLERVHPGGGIKVRLDGQTYRLGLDTGASNGVTLFAAAVWRRKLWDKFPKWLNTDGRGFVDRFKARNVRFNTLEIGDVALANPVVELIEPSSIDANPDLDGLLGLDVLRRFSVFYGHNVLAFTLSIAVKPNGAVGQPFRYNRSGMLLSYRTGSIYIAQLLPGSPAARAGLYIGDRILLPDDMTPRRFRHSLSDEPGRVLNFQAEREGKTFPVHMVLQELI